MHSHRHRQSRLLHVLLSMYSSIPNIQYFQCINIPCTNCLHELMSTCAPVYMYQLSTWTHVYRYSCLHVHHVYMYIYLHGLQSTCTGIPVYMYFSLHVLLPACTPPLRYPAYTVLLQYISKDSPHPSEFPFVRFLPAQSDSIVLTR
jgi:hypothetical protein